MPIRFTCPSCGKVLKIPDEKIGVKLSCPGCKTGFKVPASKSAPEQPVVASSGQKPPSGKASAPRPAPNQDEDEDTEAPKGDVLPSDPPKSPGLMCVLSLLIPGLGQILLGQTVKGIVMIVVTAATCGLCGLMYVIAPIDAYKIAKKLQEGNPVGNWQFF